MNSAEYEAARETAAVATRKFGKIQRTHLVGGIGDAAFLEARAEYVTASAAELRRRAVKSRRDAWL